MAERVRVLAPDGVHVALNIVGSGVISELIDFASSSKNVIPLADFDGSKEYGVHFSSGFKDDHSFQALRNFGTHIEAGRFWLPAERIYRLDQCRKRTTSVKLTKFTCSFLAGSLKHQLFALALVATYLPFLIANMTSLSSASVCLLFVPIRSPLFRALLARSCTSGALSTLALLKICRPEFKCGYSPFPPAKSTYVVRLITGQHGPDSPIRLLSKYRGGSMIIS